ncbi:hypothetical protein V8C35DRAFT_318778 [Trichoderma chlorosporum]
MEFTPPNDDAQLILSTESIGWRCLQALRSQLSDRIERFRPVGVPRNRIKRYQNEARFFESDFISMLMAKPVDVRLPKEDYDEMNEILLELLGSLNNMVNLNICGQPEALSGDRHNIIVPFADFDSLGKLVLFLSSLDSSSSSHRRFNVTTGSHPLFNLSSGNAGSLAIEQLTKWKNFLSKSRDDFIPSDLLDVTSILDSKTNHSHWAEKRASVVVSAIFKELRQERCAKEATHEIRLEVSDDLYISPSQPNLDMFVSCCPEETLMWQEAQCGSFEVMSDVTKGSMCMAIRQAMEKRRRLHIFVQPFGLFDVTDKLRPVRLPSDSFDGVSLGELFDQGEFMEMKFQDYFNNGENRKYFHESKPWIALGLSRCLMDFFDDGLELASHSWIPDNIYFRPISTNISNKRKFRLYISLRPSRPEPDTSDFIGMFANGSPMLLSFAKLLLEILDGQKIPSIQIHPKAEENLQNWLQIGDTIKRVDPKRLNVEYLSVVQSCIDLWKTLPVFEDRYNFRMAKKVIREAIYRKIVQKLELIVDPPRSKRKYSDSSIDNGRIKRNIPFSSSSNLQYAPSLATSMVLAFHKSSMSSQMAAKEEEQEDSLADNETEHATLSLYDEQEEQHKYNRRTAEKYFNDLNASIIKYIEFPIKQPADASLPLKQRSPVKVAIIDSGINMADPFISGKEEQIRGKRNWTDCNPDNWHDTYGHGTHVARLVLQVAPAVELYIARVSTGKQIKNKDIIQIATAIEWVSAVWKVDIISMSLGLDGEDEKVKKALNEVLNPECGKSKRIVIAAAANWGGNHAVAFPARHDGVLCIHSTDGQGNYSPSNPTAQKGRDNFAVLGQSIKSSAIVKVEKKLNGELVSEPRRENIYISGTSYATAIAAGIAANVLEFARHKRWSDGERELLYSSWGMSLLFKKMSDKRQGYRYIKPWKLFKGTHEEVRQTIQDALRGRRRRER